jgi:hypothetical protein
MAVAGAAQPTGPNIDASMTPKSTKPVRLCIEQDSFLKLHGGRPEIAPRIKSIA